MRWVGMPGLVLMIMPLTPAWGKLKQVAHTLPCDIRLVRDMQRGMPLPAERWAGMTAPTLVVDGGKSPQWMRNGMHALAAALPNAKYQTLPGQTHMLKAEAIAPVLTEFFKGEN
jgi:hypothetical protein